VVGDSKYVVIFDPQPPRHMTQPQYLKIPWR